MVKIIKQWWIEKENQIHPIQYFKQSFHLLVAIICKLYGEESYTHFKLEWTPLADHVAKTSQVFNWAHILSFNL